MELVEELEREYQFAEFVPGESVMGILGLMRTYVGLLTLMQGTLEDVTESIQRTVAS